MLTIIHALSPFKTCPFACPFCCAKDNLTNQNTELAPGYWENAARSIVGYKNIMLTGDTEPTLFPEWLSKLVHLANTFDLITELRTHNYKYCPTDVDFTQVWYSITDAQDIAKIPNLYQHGKQFAKEVNFALLINKDFQIKDILNARQQVWDSKFTARYLIEKSGNPSIVQWIKENHHEYNAHDESVLESYNIRIKRSYLAEYDILRQDGCVHHEWQ